MDNILNSTVEMSQAELILQLAQTNVEQEKRLKLTEGSAAALFYTYILYLEHNGIDANELFKKYILDDKEIKYEFSPKD